MRAIVTGMIATYPLGGVVWDYGQYLLGMERLGFEVYYLEDTALQTYNPDLGYYGDDCSYGLEFLIDSLRFLSPKLENRWAYRDVNGRSYGMAVDDICQLVADADVFINVSGSTLLREPYMACKNKVLIDTDPGWNHFVNYPKWEQGQGWKGTYGFRGHDIFFTYAERMGHLDCPLPSFGITWHRTRPPVLLNHWKREGQCDRWTTVMTWKNFKETIQYNQIEYGTKELEFDRVETLPRYTPAKFEVAVGGKEPPIDHWQQLGWKVVDSETISRNAVDYRHYIQSSRGEFSVAKNVYVATRSGWFSCRSVCYLAAGLPVVVQDTGFSEVIQTGEGLLAFSSLEEAKCAIEEVEANYANHCKAARAVAESYFDSDRVLGDMMHQIGLI